MFRWEAYVEFKNQMVFCVRFFFRILLCGCYIFTIVSLSWCNLGKSMQKMLSISFAFTQESTWQMLKMHWNLMWKKVFFVLNKKNVWFLLQLTSSFVFCLHCYFLAFDFLFYVFLKLDIVFIYRSTKTRVHVQA